MTDRTSGGNGVDGTAHDAEQLQRQIAETRASLGHTLDAIQDRMKPSNIASRTMGAVKEKTSAQLRHLADTATATAEAVTVKSRAPRERLQRAARRSPAGAVLIGAAAIWILVRAVSRHRRSA